MIALGLFIGAMLSASNSSNCPMNPPPLAVDTFKSSKDVKAFVVDSSKSASILLKDGSVIRVKSMGCVDSGSVAQILVPNPPPDTNLTAWRKLIAHLAKISFGFYGNGIAEWIPSAKIERTDRFILTAGNGDDPQFEVTVESTASSIGDVVTLSYTYN